MILFRCSGSRAEGSGRSAGARYARSVAMLGKSQISQLARTIGRLGAATMWIGRLTPCRSPQPMDFARGHCSAFALKAKRV